VDHHDLQVALRTEAGRNVLINLELDQGSTYLTLVRQIDRHPVRNMIRHVDFVHVSLTEKVRAQVLVHFEGTPAGLKEGGILAPGHTLIEIEALPTDIPSRIDLNISDLHIGHHMRVSDLPAIPGVEYLDEPDEIVVTVSIPAVEVAPVVEEAVEGEAVEVEAEAEAAE
jgi:large subunit ribosomal protein L25